MSIFIASIHPEPKLFLGKHPKLANTLGRRSEAIFIEIREKSCCLILSNSVIFKVIRAISDTAKLCQNPMENTLETAYQPPTTH